MHEIRRKEEWKAQQESILAHSGRNKVCTAGDVFLKAAEGGQSDNAVETKDVAEVKHDGTRINPLLHRFSEASFHNSLCNPTGTKQNFVSKP